MTRYACCNANRLKVLKDSAGNLLNAIDYVEVRDTDEPVDELRQRTLFVRLIRPVPPNLDATHLVIDGGERIPTVGIEWAVAGDSAGADLPPGVSQADFDALVAGLDELDKVLVVRTVTRGDFSRYTLRIVSSPASDLPPADFDTQLAEVEFSFKVECASDFDCAPQELCAAPVYDTPDIDYLAKDFQGFRRLMLERMSLLAPTWTERNPADMGMALVETLAYVADELSYRQDAIATEAYLETARSRVSLRRLARLVDYRVHDGCNARVWVQVNVTNPSVVLPAKTMLLTLVEGTPVRVAPDSADYRAARAANPLVFETVEQAVLYKNLDVLSFYTWGDDGCCLPAGSTAATLAKAHPHLRAGDVLVLAETVSPTTGSPDDADPTKRWAVQLVDVRDGVDPSGGLFKEPPDGSQVAVTEIRWAEEDALPFPLCLNNDGKEIAHAWGNIVLADHGETQSPEELGSVPPPRLTRVGGSCDCGCDGTTDTPPDVVPPRFSPSLAGGPLTQSVVSAPVARFSEPASVTLVDALDAHTYEPDVSAVLARHDLTLTAADTVVRGAGPVWSISDGVTLLRVTHDGFALEFVTDVPAASSTLAARPRDAIPAISLASLSAGHPDAWTPKADLLSSTESMAVFTVETEYDGTARLRFGDDEHGRRPLPDEAFTATYRVGNGSTGNVGAEAIAHIVIGDDAFDVVRNPLPAAGGTDPETGDEVRRDAPRAFATQQRAVTEADYAEVTERNGTVQRAAATFRWTGSWHTVFVTADRFAGQAVDSSFAGGVKQWLEPYRMAGYDLEVDNPVFVALEVAVSVCAGTHHERSDVAAAVLQVLGTGTLPSGGRALFHPDNLTFGQPVYLSAVYAAVQAVPGVDSLQVVTFQRLKRPETSGLDAGVLDMGRLEIARLDNDPNFPERGVLTVTVGGGR